MKRYEFPLFGFYDYTGMTCHFEKMAQKGWLLEKMGGILWHYRPIEPQRLKFAVTYFPEVTGFEPTPPVSKGEMQAFCLQAGWQLAADPGKFQVYYHEDPKAVDLDTDPHIQLDVIHKAMKKSFLPSYCLLMLSAVLQIFSQMRRLTGSYTPLWDGLVDTLSRYGWFILPAWSALALLYLWEMGRYFLWLRRARRRAQDGLMTPSPSSRGTQSCAILLLLALLLAMMFSGGQDWRVLGGIMAGLLVTLALSLGLSKIMRLQGVGAKTNRWITVLFATALSMACIALVAREAISYVDPEEQMLTYEYDGMNWRYYQEPLPLTLADLGFTGDPYVSTQREEQRSPLVSRLYGQVQPSRLTSALPELGYVVADVRLPLLMDLCRKDFLREDYTPLDPAPWGAEAAWQVSTGRFDDGSIVLEKGRRLVYLYLDQKEVRWTDWQMAAVGEKLLYGLTAK